MSGDRNSAQVDRPVFIIGCPRSGTTVFQDVLAAHEAFGWVSQAVENRPDRPVRALRNRVYDVPLLGEQLYRRRDTLPKAPVAAEPWHFFEYHLSGFKPRTSGPDAEIPRRHTPDDMTDSQALAIRTAVAENLRYQGRDRFLCKYTDYPRISYLTKAFPDARFVHITRDGRAVAHSYSKKMLSGRFGTWEEREYWIGALDKDAQDLWEGIEQSPLTLALMMWKYYIGEIREDATTVLGDQYLEVRYSELVRAPRELLTQVLEFSDLDWTPRFSRLLDHMSLTDMNLKWRAELTSSEQDLLNTMIVEPELLSLLDEG